MSKIQITTTNIGGITSRKDAIEMGKVNIIRGTSSSGKSSLLRGIHAAIVGQTPLEEKWTREIETLRLNDRSSDQAILRRGAKEGKVSVSYNGTESSIAIPLNGKISSKNGTPKALFTTMLSNLPQTKLQKAIFDPKAVNGDDFAWVVNELSDAGAYQNWHNALQSVNQEAASLRIKFENWKNKGASNEEVRAKLEAMRDEISAKIQSRSKGAGAEEAKLGKDLASEENKANIARKDYEQKSSLIRAQQAESDELNRINENAKRQSRQAERRLDDAEDLLENPPMEPDISKDDQAISTLVEKINDLKGNLEDDDLKTAIDIYLGGENVKISAASPKFTKAFEIVIAKCGDSTAVAEAMSKHKELKSSRDIKVKRYLEDKRKYSMAEQQASAARNEISSAKATIADVKRRSNFDQGQFERDKKEMELSRSTLAAADKKVSEIRAEMSKGDPEAEKDTSELKKINLQLSQIENSETFEVRFASLNWLTSDSRSLTESQVESLLGDGSAGSERKTLVDSNLRISPPEIRNKITAALDNGLLADIEATSRYAALQADNQRQETRRVFNEVGTSLFAKLKFSPIVKVSLDTDYTLKLDWQDGETTGLTGAGGERTIIASSMLIAMRKAYTPEIPILMLDGVLESLNKESSEELLSFLSEYSASEGISIIVSLLDDSKPVAEVKAR
jgi:hypothetical protein